jgi:hypothetical protein
MNITIDGKSADIILENEKTLGDLLGGLGTWLANSGYSLSGLRINGETLGAASIENAFGRDLGDINTLDIETSGLPILMAEALLDIKDTIIAFGNASFEDQRRIQQVWNASPAATFLSEQIPDIYDSILYCFRGEGLPPGSMASLIDERLRELKDPLPELKGIEGMVEEIARRLEDLPLDIQTGKDGRAAETVQIFSHITEKLFRIFSLLKLEGFITDTLIIDTVPFNIFIQDFGAALKELLAAYEAKDAVLVGDLAEYELAPRLRTFYFAIKTPVAAA